MSQKLTEDLGVMTLKNHGKFKEELTCRFKSDMRNLANFRWLKNSDFILESKMVELHKNKNSEKLDQPV